MGSKYYIYAVLLENCPYSMAAKEILTNKNIPHELIIVNQSNKNKYKTDDIQTFPQLYLKKNNYNGTLLIGGYSDIKNIMTKFESIPYNQDLVNEYCNKKKISKRGLLNIIKLINRI